MKITPKQKQLVELIDDNMQFYATKIHQLKEFGESYEGMIYANNISELVDRLAETVSYAKELEEESYRVAEKGDVQHV